MTATHIKWVGSADPAPEVGVVGGKGRSLHILAGLGLRVPEAFVVTTDAYRNSLSTFLVREIDAHISALGNTEDVDALAATSAAIRERLFIETDGHPADYELREAYQALGERLGESNPPVAVRSSSAAEDSAEHSFAGEHDSYLWVQGADEVSEAVRRCWASLFTARAISYRASQGISTADDAMAVVVQRMVDARAAGVFMTLNPVNGDRSKIVVESVWGLGEPLVSGTATPDRFVIDKVTHEILERTVVPKPSRAIRNPATGRGISSAEVDPSDQERPSLTSDELNRLLDIARTVERHAGCPQDGEFALDGDHIHLLQARPETVWSSRPPTRVSDGTKSALAHVVQALSGGSAASGN